MTTSLCASGQATSLAWTGNQIKRSGDSNRYVGSIRSDRVLPRATQPQQGQSKWCLTLSSLGHGGCQVLPTLGRFL